MVDIVIAEVAKGQLRDLVKKLIAEAIGKEIEKQTQGIFPLSNCVVRKCKIIKKPKFDITKLMELHQDTGEDDAGAAIGRPEAEDAVNALSAEIAEGAAEDDA